MLTHDQVRAQRLFSKCRGVTSQVSSPGVAMSGGVVQYINGLGGMRRENLCCWIFWLNLRMRTTEVRSGSKIKLLCLFDQ